MGQHVSAALAQQSKQFVGWQRRTVSSPNFATISAAPARDEESRRLVHPSRSLLQITRQEDIIIYALPRAYIAHCVTNSTDDFVYIVTGTCDSPRLVATPLDRGDALRESENAVCSDIHWGPCFRADPSNVIVMCPATLAGPSLDLVHAQGAAQVLTRTHELRVCLSLAYRTRAIARIVAYLPTNFVVPMFPRPTIECVLDFVSVERELFDSVEHFKINISGFIMRYIVAATCATHKCNSWETLPRARLEVIARVILTAIMRALGDNATRAVVIFPACFRDVCHEQLCDSQLFGFPITGMPALFFINHRS